MIIPYRGIGIEVRSSAEWSFLDGCLRKQSCYGKLGNTYIRRMKSGALSIKQDGKETMFREFGASTELLTVVEKYKNASYENDRNACSDVYDKTLMVTDGTVLPSLSSFVVLTDMLPGNELSMLGLGLIDLSRLTITYIPDENVKMYKTCDNGTSKVYRVEAYYNNVQQHKTYVIEWDLMYNIMDPIESTLVALSKGKTD